MDIEERMVEPYFEISYVKNLTNVLGILGIQSGERVMLGFAENIIL